MLVGDLLGKVVEESGLWMVQSDHQNRYHRLLHWMWEGWSIWLGQQLERGYLAQFPLATRDTHSLDELDPNQQGIGGRMKGPSQ